MIKKEKFVFLAHCLLNQLTRAERSFTPSATPGILTLLKDFPVFVYQLPCPEYLFLGEREKRTQDMWEKIPGFRDFLSSLASEVERRVKELIKDKEIIFIGIARSPCCSAGKVYRGEKLVEGKGLWVLELGKRFNFSIIDFDFKDVDGSLEKIRSFLEKG